MICYPGLVDKRAQHISSSRSDQTEPLSFEELTAQQGVAPVDEFEALVGRPSSEDESAEEFSAMLREWRREGTGTGSSQ